MGVSIQVYRQRIGCHHSKNQKRISSLFKSSDQKSYSVSMSLLTKLLLLSTIICLQSVPRNLANTAESCFRPSGRSSCNLFHPSGNIHSCSPTIMCDAHQTANSKSCNLPCCQPYLPHAICSSSFFQPSGRYDRPANNKPSGILGSRHLLEIIFQPHGIAWSYCNQSNKLAHALQGNKRNLGYKYLSWNCARGFLSNRKIDDLKVTINRHKPQLVGVSEVDFHRNENNSNQEATNNLSTEQLFEKLNIPGYNLFLPKSWDTLNTARIIVYAKGDLKIKHLYP